MAASARRSRVWRCPVWSASLSVHRMQPTRALSLSLLAVVLAACQESVSPSLPPAQPAATPALDRTTEPTWSVTVLPIPAGVWTGIWTTAINDSGIIVGHLRPENNRSRAVRWINGVPSFLAVSSQFHTAAATAINNSGDIVGWTQVNTLNQVLPLQPVRWNSAGALTVLPTLGWSGEATDINSSGVAVGSSRGAKSGPSRAVRWSAAGVIQDLHPAGAIWSRAEEISDDGVIVGIVQFPDGPHGWRWNTNNSTVDLGIIQTGTSVSINTVGVMLGTAMHGGVWQSVFWTPIGFKMHGPMGEGSRGIAISDPHRQVGWSIGGIAWTWRGNEVSILPLPRGATHASPAGVNRCGAIVGSVNGGSYPISVPVLWTPSVCDP